MSLLLFLFHPRTFVLVECFSNAHTKFFYHWFGAAGLAFPFGLENAISSTVSLVAGMVAIPIRDGTGWYGWSFWIPAALCVFSFLANIVYVVFERTIIPAKFRLTSERDRAITSQKLAVKKVFSWRVLLTLPWAYLMLPATQLLQSGAAGGFSINSADIIFMRGYTEAVAGYLSTGQKILPILLSPLLGLFVDRYGHRFHFVATAPILWITACALLGFTTVHPLVPLVFSSLAGVINAMPLQLCIPLLVADQSKLGTAFGLWRAFNNSGSTIVSTSSLSICIAPSPMFSSCFCFPLLVSILANRSPSTPRWMLYSASCRTIPQTMATPRFYSWPLASKRGHSYWECRTF